jgi:subtilisin family serine protease
MIRLSLLFLIPTMAAAQNIESRLHISPSHSLTRGQNIVVAVIDTGIDVHHPALRDSLWVNTGETGRDAQGRNREQNQIDDDGNGFIDDVHGWNFVANNNDLTDHHGHGTHIAGIIAARRQSPFNFEGIAPEVKLMILKYYDPKSLRQNNVENSTAALQYALKMKARIINFSSGGDKPNAAEEMTLRQAISQNVLVVAAAGNNGLNNDSHGFYPASYGLENTISVASLKENEDRLLTSSNFGLASVDVAAPGENIFSTMPNGQYGRMSGTSQATAFVTGVAALTMALKSKNENVVALKRRLLAVSQPIDELKEKMQSGGCIDALTALTTWPEGKNAFGENVETLSRLQSDSFTIRTTQSLPVLKRQVKF